MTKIPIREEIIELARKLATPVDFEQLEKEGVIEKKGAWYKVKDFKSLPVHAYDQIRSVKNDSNGNCLVQFPKSWKRAQQLYRRMTGKEFDE